MTLKGTPSVGVPLIVSVSAAASGFTVTISCPLVFAAYVASPWYAAVKAYVPPARPDDVNVAVPPFRFAVPWYVVPPV
jgi:hypothetical protein